MKAGVIGIMDGEVGEIEPHLETVTQDGTDFTECIQIRSTERNVGTGYTVQTGRAAIQRIENQESVDIGDDGRIGTVEEPVKVTDYTEFVAVPGEFIAVSSGAGTFAFNLVQRQYPTALFDRAKFDLTSFGDANADSSQWQVGFYGNLGQAEKGIVYGDGVLDDQEVGKVLEQSQINQLGLQYQRGERTVKMTITESGYVNIYQPSNYDAVEFAQYVVEELLDHVKEK